MKPTIFTSVEEIAEAVKVGYLARDSDYSIGGRNEHKLPTLFLGEGHHQPNEDNAWSNINYLEHLVEASFWSDIRGEYVQTKKKLEIPLTQNNLVNIMEKLKINSTVGDVFGTFSEVELMTPDEFDQRIK